MVENVIQAARILAASIERTNSEYIKHAKEMRDMYADTSMIPGRAGREQRQVQRQAEVEATKKVVDGYDSLFKATAKWSAQTKKGTKQSKEATDDLNEALRKLYDDGLVKAGSGFDQLVKGLRGTRYTAQNVDMLGRAAATMNAQHSKEYDLSIKRLNAQDKFMRQMDALGDSIKGMIEKATSFQVALGVTTAGIIRSFDELEFSLKHQTEMYTMLGMSMENWAGSLGLAPLELQEIVAKYRPLIHATADDYLSASEAVTQTVKTLKDEQGARQSLIQQAYEFTGNFRDATHLIMGTMQQFKTIGIEFTFDQLRVRTEMLNERFAGLSRVTGQSVEAVQQQVMDLQQSTEAQAELLMMSKSRRRNYQFELATQMENLAIVGKFGQTASEAAKALRSIAGMDPRERFREAARIQAVMGAMGLRGGQEVRRLFAKPIRDPEEQEALRQHFDRLSREYQRRLGAGGGTAMVAGALFGKMGAQTQDIIMKQNTTLDEGLAISREQFDLIKSNAPKLSSIESTLKDIKKFFDQFARPFFKDPGVNVLLGALMGIGSVLSTIAQFVIGGAILRGGLGGLFPKLGGMFGMGGAAAGAAGAAGMRGMGPGGLGGPGGPATGVRRGPGARFGPGAGAGGAPMAAAGGAARGGLLKRMGGSLARFGIGRALGGTAAAILGGPIGWAIGLGTLGYGIYQLMQDAQGDAAAALPGGGTAAFEQFNNIEINTSKSTELLGSIDAKMATLVLQMKDLGTIMKGQGREMQQISFDEQNKEDERVAKMVKEDRNKTLRRGRR